MLCFELQLSRVFLSRQCSFDSLPHSLSRNLPGPFVEPALDPIIGTFRNPRQPFLFSHPFLLPILFLGFASLSQLDYWAVSKCMRMLPNALVEHERSRLVLFLGIVYSRDLKVCRA